MNICWSYIHIWEIEQIRNTQIRNTNKKSWEFLNIIHVTDKKRPFYSLQDVFKGFPHPWNPIFYHSGGIFFVILLLYYFKTYYSIVVEDLFGFHQGTDILVHKCKYCHIPKLSINYKNLKLLNIKHYVFWLSLSKDHNYILHGRSHMMFIPVT